jgi:hypothetical protein
LGGVANDGVNPTGSPLVRNYGDELRGDVIADRDGNVFVSTVTASSDFPVINGFDLSYNEGTTDGLLIKLTGNLEQISWATFLGGSGVDASHTIQIDKAGDLFVAGGTNSVDFPTTTGAYQVAIAGSVDGWIAKVKGDGSALMNGTFTGTSLFNQVYFLDLDQQESVFVYGQTQGAFPTTPGVYKNANSGQFLQKFDNTLSTLIFSTVFGSGIGIPNISPTAFLVNDCNTIYLAGWGGELNGLLGFWNSTTAGMAVTPDALQTTTRGSDFYLMVLSGDATQLLYATYLGGTTSRTHLDGGTCRFDKGGVVYHAVCSGCSFNRTGQSQSDFPTTDNAWSRVNGSTNCNNAAFKFDLSSLRARIQTNSVALDQPGFNTLCVGEEIVFQNKSIGGQTYFWDFGDTNKLVKSDQEDIRYKYASTGSFTVKLKAVDVGTCIGKDSTQTKVFVNTPLGFIGPDQVICFEAGTELVASGGVIYQWRIADNSVISGQAMPRVNPTETTTYVASVTDVNGCTVKDDVTVRVVPGIDIKFSAERLNQDCEGLPSLKVVSQTDAQENLFFDFGDGMTSDLPSTIHTYTKEGVFPVRQIGTRESCVYTKEILIPIFETKIPNVFTPDQSPGYNDTFQINYGGKSIAQSDLVVAISIFNRWGGKVYQNENYKGDWAAKEVGAGVYYYDVQISGETSCKGWVHVVK